MSLANLIKKGSLRGLATATPATFATHEPFRPPTVATVAVAKAPDTAANDPTPGAVLDPDRHCWPHSPAMNTAEIDRFIERLARFTDRGVTLEGAERIADRLVMRDRQKDDRAVCLECTHLHRAGRCGNWQRAGVAIRPNDTQLGGDFVNLLQRCDGFNKEKL
jgi:hypothetical protein